MKRVISTVTIVTVLHLHHMKMNFKCSCQCLKNNFRIRWSLLSGSTTSKQKSITRNSIRPQKRLRLDFESTMERINEDKDVWYENNFQDQINFTLKRDNDERLVKDKEKIEFEFMHADRSNLFLSFCYTTSKNDCNHFLEPLSSNFIALESFLGKVLMIELIHRRQKKPPE